MMVTCGMMLNLYLTYLTSDLSTKLDRYKKYNSIISAKSLNTLSWYQKVQAKGFLAYFLGNILFKNS